MRTFPLARPARIAVFASGRGSNLESLLAAFGPDNRLGQVVLVVSNRSEAGALKRAAAGGVAAYHIPFGVDRERFEGRARDLLAAENIDLICLAGFMRVLSAEFVCDYAGRLLNIHPSLLPHFPGLAAPAQALAAGVEASGCTVHFVDDGVDTGPIVLQVEVPVKADDTVETLSARILTEEHRAYPEAVRRVLSGQENAAIEALRQVRA